MSRKFPRILFRTVALLLLSSVFPLAACSRGAQTDGTHTEEESSLPVAEAETRQYLDTEPTDREPLPDDGIYVRYSVNAKAAGKICGRSKQKLEEGEKTSAVTAEAALGYRFVIWSDGTTTPSREGDSPESSVTLTAIFDYDILSLPVLLLNTETGKDVTSKKEYIGASVSLIGSGDCDFTDNAVSVRGRGNNTWHYEKKSYRFKLSKKRNILDIASGKSKSWVLLANMCDQSLLRNDTALSLGAVFSHVVWEPAATSVEVYLNGEYRGVYLLAEAITVESHRVALDESETETETDIGYLIKLSYYADTVDFVVAGKQYEIRSNLSSDEITAKRQRKTIGSYTERCWNAIKTGNRSAIEDLVDLDSLIDAYLLEEYVKNLDMGWDSFYLVKDAGGRLRFGPCWDFDLSFGNGNETCEKTEGIYCGICYNEALSNPWFYQMNRYPWFRALCKARWNELYPKLCQVPEYVIRTAEEGYDSFCRNFEKWNIFGQRMNRETERITSLRTYREHFEYLAKWIRVRGEWLDRYFNGSGYLNGTFTDNIEIPPTQIGNSEAESLLQKYTVLNSVIKTETIRAENDAPYPNEGVDNLLDMCISNKYCTDCSRSITVTFSLDQARSLGGYLLITANDTELYAERNPDGWTLYGSNDKTNWAELDHVQNGKTALNAVNDTAYGFEIDYPQSFRYYKIEFRNEGILQFSDMILLG